MTGWLPQMSKAYGQKRGIREFWTFFLGEPPKQQYIYLQTHQGNGKHPHKLPKPCPPLVMRLAMLPMLSLKAVPTFTCPLSWAWRNCPPAEGFDLLSEIVRTGKHLSRWQTTTYVALFYHSFAAWTKCTSEIFWVVTCHPDVSAVFEPVGSWH